MKFTDLFKKKKTKKRKYEGASKGRRTSGWITGSTDVNETIRQDLPWLRERSRYLRRNNGYAHKGIELITNNVIGKGISTQINNDPQEIAMSLWSQWAGTPACDLEGRNNLKGLQRIAMDAIVESGEIFVRKRFVNDPKFPIKYQLLESDFLNTSMLDGEQKNGNTIIQGIEFNSLGQRVGYHLYETHPGSTSSPSTQLKSNFIPASEVYHLFRTDRPSQIRGVPWLSSVMIKLKDLDGFEDSQLLRAKIASLFVAFVRDISADVDCEDESDDLGEKMVPGLIEHLPPGKSVEFADPPAFQLYTEFVASQLRHVAAGLGLTYESLANDLTNTNYSSGRMGWIEMHRNIESWREHIIINQFMRPIEDDFKMLASLNNVRLGDISFDHIGAKRELIDPSKETKAMVESIRAGLESRSSVIQSLGRDPKKVNEQIIEDNKLIDQNNLILDSDPRNTNIAGTKQISEEANEKSNEN